MDLEMLLTGGSEYNERKTCRNDEKCAGFFSRA